MLPGCLRIKKAWQEKQTILQGNHRDNLPQKEASEINAGLLHTVNWEARGFLGRLRVASGALGMAISGQSTALPTSTSLHLFSILGFHVSFLKAEIKL